MVDEPTYIKNFRILSRSDPQFDHLEAIERELYGASDRAAAVMLGSMVETSLRRLLTTLFRNDLNSIDQKRIFEFEGALGSFASKIVLAYALKLIGPISRADLDLIRFLRNEFAHSRMSYKFTTPEVKAVCDHLQMPDLSGSYVPNGYIRRIPQEEQKAALDSSHPKTRFVSACHNLAYRMIVARDGPKEGDTVFRGDNPLP
jgi:hypothetical protein